MFSPTRRAVKGIVEETIILITSMISYLETFILLVIMIGIARIRLPISYQVHRYWAIGLIGLWEIFRWVIQHDINPTLIWSHHLAFAHIVFSQTAHVLVITAIACTLTSLPVKLEKLIRLSLIYQGIGIILGMFWAYDAPDWGSFWQWDFIEISALYIWFSLYAWNHSHPNTRNLWAINTLILIFIQTLSLYAGLGETSRHGYAVTQQLPVFAGIIILSCALLSSRKFCIRQHYPIFKYTEPLSAVSPNTIISYIEHTCLLIITGIMIICGFGLSFPAETGLCLLSLVLWLALLLCDREKRYLLHQFLFGGFGVVTALSLILLPVQIEDQWIKTEMPENQLSLQGVKLLNSDDCNHYQFGIGINSNDETHVQLVICQDQIIHTSPSYYVSFHPISLMRIQALDYRANQGVLLRIRDCRLDVLFALWLVFILIFALIWSFRIRVIESTKRHLN